MCFPYSIPQKIFPVKSPLTECSFSSHPFLSVAHLPFLRRSVALPRQPQLGIALATRAEVQHQAAVHAALEVASDGGGKMVRTQKSHRKMEMLGYSTGENGWLTNTSQTAFFCHLKRETMGVLSQEKRGF